MIKLSNVLFALILGINVVGCSDGSNSTSEGWSSKNSVLNQQASGNWQIVGNDSLKVPNITFSSLGLSSNGTVYAGGGADVINGLVVGNTGTSGDWQFIGGGYTPVSPIPSYGQVGALVVSSTNIIYAAVNMWGASTPDYASGILVYSNPNEKAGAWQVLSPSFLTLPDDGIINSLALDNTNTIYAATSAGYTSTTSPYQIGNIGNVYSIQAGTVKQIGRGSAPDKGVMNSVLVANGTVYAASGGYAINSVGAAAYFGDVYSADSAGTSAWKQIGGRSTPDQGVANSIALSNDKNSIYVATSNGNVYKSPVSASGVWSKALGGVQVPDGSAINSIDVANSGVVYVATALGNVYRASDTSVWQPGGTVPDGWSINSLAVYG